MINWSALENKGFMYTGGILQGIGSLWGAYDQNKINQRNYQADEAFRNMLLGRAQGMMQDSPSRYSEIINQLLGSNGGMQMAQFTPQDAPQVTMPQFSPTAQADSPMMVAGTQGSNAGQDALMQMMRRDVGNGPNAFLQQNLQDLSAGNSRFDNSGLFAALAPIDQRMLDEQVAQLHGSAGSLGRRFGTALSGNEQKLRGNFLQDVTSRNAQIQQSSFENAQNRRVQGLGQLGAMEQFYGQQPFQNAQLQMQAAMAAGQLGQAGAGLNLQAQLANQAALANQQQFNAQAMNQGNQFNTQLASQLGQFNANQRLANQQFNAQMGLQGNNQLMQLLNMGNQFQYGQQSQNAQLLALMQGLRPGQQQPSAWPGALSDIGMTMMMAQYLNNSGSPVGGGGGGGSGGGMSMDNLSSLSAILGPMMSGGGFGGGGAGAGGGGGG